jgi:hypothetical protein
MAASVWSRPRPVEMTAIPIDTIEGDIKIGLKILSLGKPGVSTAMSEC